MARVASTLALHQLSPSPRYNSSAWVSLRNGSSFLLHRFPLQTLLKTDVYRANTYIVRRCFGQILCVPKFAVSAAATCYFNLPLSLSHYVSIKSNNVVLFSVLLNSAIFYKILLNFLICLRAGVHILPGGKQNGASSWPFLAARPVRPELTVYFIAVCAVGEHLHKNIIITVALLELSDLFFCSPSSKKTTIEEDQRGGHAMAPNVVRLPSLLPL